MQHVGRVNVLESAQQLVQEILHVLVGEGLRRADDFVQVGVHQVSDHVQIGAVGVACGVRG